MFNRLRIKTSNQTKNWKMQRIYKKFEGFTMIPQQTYINNLSLAEKISQLEGCVVECGVWKGGMIAGMADILGPKRKYYLFDSFEGLPKAQEIDGKAATQWQENVQSPGYYNNCSASEEFARQAMTLSNAENFILKNGWFENTLPSFQLKDEIVLLRLDADWYDSTKICLDYLFDSVTAGGLIILDDYYAWDGCSKAIHDFLSLNSKTERINSYHGVCFLEKK
jgi:O-methyltransferase